MATSILESSPRLDKESDPIYKPIKPKKTCCIWTCLLCICLAALMFVFDDVKWMYDFEAEAGDLYHDHKVTYVPITLQLRNLSFSPNVYKSAQYIALSRRHLRCFWVQFS